MVFNRKYFMKRQGMHDHYAQFGDATTSQIADKRKGVNDEGQSVWIFLLWPSREQKALYDLNENPNYFPEDDIIRLEVPSAYVEVIQNSPRRTRIFIRCAFDGSKTDLTERDTHLVETIKYLEKDVSSLQTALAKAMEDLKTSRTNTHEYVQDSMELVKILQDGKSQKSKEEILAELAGQQPGE